MTGSTNELTTGMLLERQDEQAARQERQLTEIRSEIRELAKLSKENAVEMKELIGVLRESEVESRHTRIEVEEIKERVKDCEDDQEEVKSLLLKKTTNQKLIITICGTILASMFTFFGWMIGKG